MKAIFLAAVSAASLFSTVAFAGKRLLINFADATGNNISSSYVDRIVDRANYLLRSQSSDDFDCTSITLERNGSVQQIDPHLGSVTTKTHLSKLLWSANASAIFVSDLSYCGGYMPNAVGCATRNSSVVVEDGLGIKSLGHILLHEIAHTKNLSRATDGTAHTQRPRAVMYATVSPHHVKLTGNECEVLSTGNYAKFDVEDALVVANSDLVEMEEQPDPEFEDTSDINRLLHEVWIEGIPVDQLKQVGVTDSMGQIRENLVAPVSANVFSNSSTAYALFADADQAAFLFELTYANNEGVPHAAQRILSLINATSLVAGRLPEEFFSSYVELVDENTINELVFRTGSNDPNAARRAFTRSVAGLIYSGERALPVFERLSASYADGQNDYGFDETFWNDLREEARLVDELGLEGYLQRALPHDH